MSSIPRLQNLAAFARVRATGSGSVPARQQFAAGVDQRTDLLRARNRLQRLFRAVETLSDLMNVRTRFRLDLPDARSTASLGLDLTTTAAHLQSVDEINASPHSFTPFAPLWIGASTAQIAIGGEYDGSHGSGDLTFEVRRPGIRGVDNLRIRVEDPQGQRIRNLNVRSNDALDQQYDLQNGLYLTLGVGQLIDDETTTIAVSQGAGSVFDPDKPFDGLLNDNPNFQYYDPPDTLLPVQDGAFELNGENIAVGAADTLNEVIDRINQSTAGVTATYNAATERLELLQDTTGSGNTIDLGSDSSNLIAASKLDVAILQPGTDPENEHTLETVAPFSAVQSGSILINDTPVSIDVQADSLDSVIAAINASTAGVSAAFDEQTQRVTLAAGDPRQIFELDSNGTGLFAALNIVEGRVDPVAGRGGISRTRSYDIADAVASLFGELNGLFDARSFLGRETSVIASQDRVAAAVDAVFGDASGDIDGRFGLHFDASDDARARGSFADLDRSTLTRALQTQGGNVRSLIAGPDENSGLIGRLVAAAGRSLAEINRKLGFSGGLVDTFA